MNRYIALIVSLVPVLVLAPDAQAERPRIYAITGARIVPAPDQIIEKGTIVLRGGLIEAIGADVAAPADAEIIEAEEGWTIYPAFIDAASRVGLGEDESEARPGRSGGDKAQPGSPHEVKAVHPEKAVIDELDTSHGNLEKHREIGFAVAQSLPGKGVFRGQTAIVAMREGMASELILTDRAAQVINLESSSFMARQYPSSKIGAMATVRQALLDAQRQLAWQTRYEANPKGLPRPEFRSSDAALMSVVQKATPVVFVSGSDLDPGRFAGLAQEFNLDAVTLARDLSEDPESLAAANMPILLPLEMPEKPEIKTEDDAKEVSLEDMQKFLLAPKLPAALAEAEITFAFVTYGMKSERAVSENLAAIVENGLDENRALAALTTVPAKLLGLEATLGTLETGKLANLLIVEGALFTKKPVFKHIFVDGYHEEVEAEETKGDPNAVVDPSGVWEIQTEVMGRSSSSTWTISGTADAWEGFSESDQTGKTDFTSVELSGNALTVVRPTQGGEMEVTVVIDDDKLEGETTMESPRGSVKISVEGRRVSKPESEEN